MAIEWSRNLSTGVGMGKDELDRVFRFLDSYIVVHFDAEEQAMSKYDFPHAMEHLREHTGFIEAVAALRHEFATGATAVLVVKVQQLVVDWLINHIGGEDKKLGVHIIKSETAAHARD